MWPEPVVSIEDLGDVSDHGKQAELMDARIDLRYALSLLTRAERKAILLHAAGHDDTEIGCILGMSRRRACDIRHSAQQTMRAALA